VAVAATLHGDARGRLLLEVVGHHRGGAAQEGEWTDQHALIANRDQLGHAGAVGLGQDGDRVALGGAAQIRMFLAGGLFAQTGAVIITLCERPGQSLSHRYPPGQETETAAAPP
jgi:hypothetical protein